MMANTFITADGRLLARWAEAFPDAAALSAADAVPAGADGGLCWIATDLPDWPARTARICAMAGMRAIVLSAMPAGREGLQALEAGARGYCHAYATAQMLREVRLVVSHGGLWVGPELMARAIRASVAALPVPARETGALGPLSDRELEVAYAVAEGLTNKEAALRLAITERTVKAHLASVFAKLGVRDRLQLALRVAAARAAERLEA